MFSFKTTFSPRTTRLGRKAFGAAFLTVSPLALNALSLPAMAFIIRRLGDVHYGQWMTAVALVGTTTFLTSLGLRPRFIRAVAQDPPSSSALLAQQLGLRGILSLLASAVAIAACLALHYPAPVVTCAVIGCIAMVLRAAATTAGDFMQAREQFGALAAINTVAGLALTVGSVIAAQISSGPALVALSYVIGPAISCVAMLALIRRSGFAIRVSCQVREALSLLWSCRHLTVQQVLTVGNMNAASLMLPKLVTAGEFGLFSAGTLLTDRLALIPDSVGTVLYPIVARASGHNARKASAMVLCWLTGIVGLCAAVALAEYLAANWIGHILFPSEAAACARIIRLTCWSLPLVGAECAIVYALIAAGREATQARATLYGVVTGLALGAFLIFHWGLVGACWFIVIRPVSLICFRVPDYLRVFVSPVFETANRRARPGAVETAEGRQPTEVECPVV